MGRPVLVARKTQMAGMKPAMTESGGSRPIRVRRWKSPFQRAGCTLFPKSSEARSNTGAVRHAHELVVRPIRTFAGVHRPAADLAVRGARIVGRGLLMVDFIQRPAMRALEGLGHPMTIGSNR